MRKNKLAKGWITACLIAGVTLAPFSGVRVQAAEGIATVSGTVRSGTTAELLLLSTKEGNMEIKIDSGTDASACKVLLPGESISVSVSHGSDEYLHAVKITAGEKKPVAAVDSSNASTVTGTITKKGQGDILFVKTPQGDMEIKLDASTNMSGCSVIVADKTYTIVCARGSDAYMHAISISDGISAGAQGAVNLSLTPAPAGAVTAQTTAVTGTVSGKTREDRLFLDTRGGEMEIVIDANTDSRYGMVIMPDRNINVAVYNGGDGYMHAASIVAPREAVFPVNVDTSSTSTVTGTVGEKSTENILYLDTKQGQMELKLDKLGSVAGCKILVSGKKLSVSCARGDDAYMHAVSITAV